MLNAHPQIAAPPECGFLQWWFSKYESWDECNAASAEDVVHYVNDVLASKKIETWGLDRQGLIEFITRSKPAGYASLGISVYLYWAIKQQRNPTLIVDKNNYYVRHLKELNRIWDDAKYIHIIRDGRDVACSYLDVGKLNMTSPYQPELPRRLKDIADEWVFNNTSIGDFLQRMDTDRYVTIRYEDLVQSTQTVLQRITDFLGIPFSGRMLEYYKYNDEPESTLAWKKKTLEPPDPEAIGRYKKQLSEQENELFESVAASMLKQFNYL